jgi:hypothetical protein
MKLGWRQAQSVIVAMHECGFTWKEIAKATGRTLITCRATYATGRWATKVREHIKPELVADEIIRLTTLSVISDRAKPIDAQEVYRRVIAPCTGCWCDPDGSVWVQVRPADTRPGQSPSTRCPCCQTRLLAMPASAQPCQDVEDDHVNDG